MTTMGATEILLSLFFVAVVGFSAGKFGLFDVDARKVFSKFVFYIASSAVIFAALASLTPSDLQKLPKFVAVNSLIYILLFVLLYVVLRLAKIRYALGGTIFYTGLSANCLFLGLPFINALYGSEGVLYAFSFLAIPLSVADLAGFYGLSKWRHRGASISNVLKDFVLNPIILATFAGIGLLLLGTGLWAPLDNAFRLLGSGATGVALFSIGLFLSSVSWRHFKVGPAVAISFIKLLVVPAAAWLVGMFFGLTDVALAVTVLMAAMPSAIFCMVVATEYDLDERATADGIILSSLLFLGTSLFWVHLIQ